MDSLVFDVIIHLWHHGIAYASRDVKHAVLQLIFLFKAILRLKQRCTNLINPRDFAKYALLIWLIVTRSHDLYFDELNASYSLQVCYLYFP